MWSILVRIIGVLLIIYGFSHWQMTTAWSSKDSARSWALGEDGAAGLGNVLWTSALIGFLLSGIAVLAGLGLWRTLAVICALISLITMIHFWDRRKSIVPSST